MHPDTAHRLANRPRSCGEQMPVEPRSLFTSKIAAVRRASILERTPASAHNLKTARNARPHHTAAAAWPRRRDDPHHAARRQSVAVPAMMRLQQNYQARSSGHTVDIEAAMMREPAISNLGASYALADDGSGNVRPNHHEARCPINSPCIFPCDNVGRSGRGAKLPEGPDRDRRGALRGQLLAVSRRAHAGS